MRYKSILLWLIIVLLFSCKTEEDKKIIPLSNESGVDVIILNEGNFGSGNASIDWYNSSNNKLYDHVFKSNNQNRPIGDVVQSMQIIGDKGYIVVNNSQKIEVVNLSDFKSIGSIQGLTSPRYILPINESKAYVSDLYANAISVINLKDRVVEKTIPTNGWTEQMVRIEDSAYVCDLTNNQLLVLNLQTDSIIKRTQLIRQPGSMVKDKNNNLWVLCNGGFDEMIPRLYQINTSGEIIQVVNFDNINQYPSNLLINEEKDHLFYFNDGIFRMSITDQSLPSQPFIEKKGRLFYGMGFHPSSSELYVADAIDYQQRGKVYRFDLEGNEIATFQAGIIPTGFIFLP